MPYRKYSEDINLLAIQMAQKNRSRSEINTFLDRSISTRSLGRWRDLYQRTQKSTQHVYLDKIQQQLELFTDIKVSQSTISRQLPKQLGLSLLVTCGIHKDQSAINRAKYIMTVAGIPPKYLVFIDECGIVGRECDQEHIWAPKGGQTVLQVQNSDQDHWTLLPVVCKQGMLAGVAVRRPFERVHVELFLKHNLLPVMNPYPVLKSVLVLDNAQIHHGGLIKTLCKQAGVLLIYLPAYLPNFNPIEKSFNSKKSQLQREAKWQLIVDKAVYILDVAGHVITHSLMQPLIVNCGYTTHHYWKHFNEEMGV